MRLFPLVGVAAVLLLAECISTTTGAFGYRLSHYAGVLAGMEVQVMITIDPSQAGRNLAVAVNWGDGSVSARMASLDERHVTFERFEHAFLFPGTYEVLMGVAEDGKTLWVRSVIMEVR